LELSKVMENIYFIRQTVGELGCQKAEPEKVAKLAYNYYWDYNCEYGVITAFNEAAGYPLTYQQVREVSKGLPHRWNAVCGAVTGAFFVLATTLPEEELERGVKELIAFHNETPLPLFKGRRVPELPKVAVGSVLCRDSIVNWCRATGINPRSLERAERCAAITADVAGKCAELVSSLAGQLIRE
jgi:hypothetical protein